MCLLCWRWDKEFEDRPSTSLSTKYHDLDPPTQPWVGGKHLGPTDFAYFKRSGNITPIVIFEHTTPSSCVRTKQTRIAHRARRDPERRKKQLESAFVDIRHRPVGMYANEPLSGWKSKPLGAVKSALSHW